MPTPIIPGLITINGRNIAGKRELYISDIPTDRNTIIFRLQNGYTKPINLKKGFQIKFPTGLFDDTTKLAKVNCQVSKWAVSHGDLINTSDLQGDIANTVKNLQQLKFANIDDQLSSSTMPTSKTGLDTEIKQMLGKYLADSLEIKKNIQTLFSGYFKNKTPNMFDNFGILSGLHNNLTELNNQIEGNIAALIGLKSDFQEQRNSINTLAGQTVQDIITAQLKKLSGKNLFDNPDNTDGPIAALTQLGEILNKLKLNPNLINLLSEHDRKNDTWTIETTFDENQQCITITSTDANALILAPGEYFVIEISSFEISQAAANGNISLAYAGATIDNSADTFKGQFSQDVAFSIIKKIGQLLPLYVELDQNSRLINDGETVNELLFKITNTGLKTIPIPYNSIEIRFGLQQQSGIYPQALIEGDKLSTLDVSITDIKNTINKKIPVSNETQTKNARISCTESDTYSLKKNTQLLVSFKNIVTDLPSGNIPISFVFKNIEGYKDRFYDIPVKRALADILYKKMPLDGFTKTDNFNYEKLIPIPQAKEYYFTKYSIEGKKPAELSIQQAGAQWRIIAKTTKNIKVFKDSMLQLQFMHYSMTNKPVKPNPYELTIRKSEPTTAQNYMENHIMFVSSKPMCLKSELHITYQFYSQADYTFFKTKGANAIIGWWDSSGERRTQSSFDIFDDEELKVYRNYASDDVYIPDEKNTEGWLFFVGGRFPDNKDCPDEIMYAIMTITVGKKVSGQTIALRNVRVPILPKKQSS